MIEFRGYYIDKQNMVVPGIDADGNVTWWLITFLNEVVDNTIVLGDPGKKFFDMKEIDPNDFEWNGQKLRIEFGGSDEKEDSYAMAQRGAPEGSGSAE